MLRIALLTVEDENAEAVYEEIHKGLKQWLFVKKGLVELQRPARREHRWVTNLADWSKVIDRLCAENDLVFCTVDLRIPAEPDDDSAEVRHGLEIVNRIEARQDDGLRCCVLTGRSGVELREAIGVSAPNVLFDFKRNLKQAFRNIVDYIKSQVLPLVQSVSFSDSDRQHRTVLLREPSGRLHSHYLSKAPYYTDKATWHVPTLIIGRPGLGRQTLVEFIAFLADATPTVVNLECANKTENEHNFALLQELQQRVESAAEVSGRQIFYIRSIDNYDPETMAREGQDCLWPLRKILDQLRRLGSTCAEGFPIGIVFSVSGDNRMQIASSQARDFIRSIEQSIGEMTDLPLHHLGLDKSGWTVDHPRIVTLPRLDELGRQFRLHLIQSQLEALQEKMFEEIPGYQGEALEVSDEVLDFVCDKYDWTPDGNLSGIVGALDAAFQEFLQTRSTKQFQITRGHLPSKLRDRLQSRVLNADEVRLEFPRENGEKLLVVERADFHVEKGEILVILGPSGCGKSTILRMLAGLLKPTKGTMTYYSEPITRPSGKIGFIFQDYSLFPWLTVRQNIEFGPKLRGISSQVSWPKVQSLLEVAKLSGFDNAYPAQLSGGMQQRVAIVRVLANDPDVLLMDEPFGALDVLTRWQMQDFLIETNQLTKKTIVFVTHDIDEAVYVGNRIYVASPRPLHLSGDLEFVIPFSAHVRNNALRRDPMFVAKVSEVRDSLLAEASSSAIGDANSAST